MENDVPGWHLSIPDSTSALHWRQDFVHFLKNCGAVGDYEAAEIIFGEIVANAIIHAPGPIEVSLTWVEGRATLHVSDVGAPLDASALTMTPDVFADHGRGLVIVRRLSPAAIASITYSDGKTISAVLPVRLG
jgi:anti-sigma regulatory factor (Ser/Thr protein kinase)